MTSKVPVSVFIITLNEADRVKDTIATIADLVEDIVVIDSGSTDGTVALCESLGARVFHNAWPGYGAQKRFGEEQCRYDWVLNLDADECLTDALKEEIRALFRAGTPPSQGYKVRIYELFPGETKIPFRCRHINCIRLYNRNYGRFSASPVHDTVQMESGSVSQLKAGIRHYSSRSISHSIEKLNRYSSMQVADMEKRGIKLSWWRLYSEGPLGFCKAYFGRWYFLRGYKGFIYAVLYAFSRFARVAKYFELFKK